jgi:hypothetical protein
MEPGVVIEILPLVPATFAVTPPFRIREPPLPKDPSPADSFASDPNEPEPLEISTTPPIPTLESPAATIIAPAWPFTTVPDFNEIDPDRVSAGPEYMETEPESFEEEDAMMTSPEDDGDEPDDNNKGPERLVSLLPPIKVIAPPAVVTLFAPLKRIPPGDAFSLDPALIKTFPLGPMAEDPLPNVKSPLLPLLNEAPELMRTLPDDSSAELDPDLITTRPPSDPSPPETSTFPPDLIEGEAAI